MPSPQPLKITVCSVCEESWDRHLEIMEARAWSEWEDDEGRPTIQVPDLFCCIQVLKEAGLGPMGPPGPMGPQGSQGPMPPGFTPLR